MQPSSPDLNEQASHPPLWLAITAAAAAGGMGWGIRGPYGHEPGAKDAQQRLEHLGAVPRKDRDAVARRQTDPEQRIRSAQSVRLFGW